MSQQPGRRRVMVVDDNEDIRMALEELLESEGYAVACAENGADALAQLRDGAVRPCIILLDYHMPVMDGLAFRREQRDDRELGDIPVIMYSGAADIRRQAHALDVLHVFQKPLNLNALVEQVQHYC